MSGCGLSALLGGDIGKSLDNRGLACRKRDAALLPKLPNPPRLKPRPDALEFVCNGAGGSAFEDTDSGLAGDSGFDSDPGLRTRPASFMAAFSSAWVGSLIGDFVVWTGEEGWDCRPHKAVAAFTEENPDFWGDGSSFLTLTLGAGISFSAAGFGDSFGGGVGNGRENLEDVIDGDGDGDNSFGDLIDEMEGDLRDSGLGVC